MKALVTGGGGFLGGAIACRLADEGHEVLSVSRAAHPELAAAGVRHLSADLGDPAAVEALYDVLAETETVFHVAAKAGVWGPRGDYWHANVSATRNVLRACRELGVARLVYTSSPSVVFDGRDHRRAGNDLPYPKEYPCAYPETKAIAEREVLAANGTGGLATCALRPHLIFGPGDPHLVPRLVEKARKRKLVRVGAGENEVSLTYVENAAQAHLDAERCLVADAPHAGRAYFIAQEEAVLLWEWIADLLRRLELPPVTRSIKLPALKAVAGVLELAWKLLPLSGEPPMTRFVAAQLATSHSYDLEPARRDFGYVQAVSMDEAMDRLIASLR